jgi:hypothetical protein
VKNVPQNALHPAREDHSDSPRVRRAQQPEMKDLMTSADAANKLPMSEVLAFLNCPPVLFTGTLLVLDERHAPRLWNCVDAITITRRSSLPSLATQPRVSAFINDIIRAGVTFGSEIGMYFASNLRFSGIAGPQRRYMNYGNQI